MRKLEKVGESSRKFETVGQKPVLEDPLLSLIGAPRVGQQLVSITGVLRVCQGAARLDQPAGGLCAPRTSFFVLSGTL